MNTHTVPQPFMRINTPTACADRGRHAPQIVPVAGNADRRTHVFVVQHGRGYLTAAGEVTSTPVWLTWTEAVAAEQAHADEVTR